MRSFAKKAAYAACCFGLLCLFAPGPAYSAFGRPSNAATVEEAEQQRLPVMPPQPAQSMQPQPPPRTSPVDAQRSASSDNQTPRPADFTPPKKGEKILINFVDVEIPTVVNFISKLTGKNFIYDERVTGRVTIVAPSKITVDEAFDLLTSVLRLKGYSVSRVGVAYKIGPAIELKQGPLDVVTDGLRRVNESFVARLFTLQSASASDVLPAIQPLISKEGHISSFGKGNSLLVVDSSLNIEKIENILKVIDTDLPGRAPEIVYLKNAQAETVVSTLRQIKRLPQAKKDSTQDTGGPMADKRLNAIILFGTEAENAEYKKSIAILDVPSPEASSKINVHYLENADATEIAKVIEGITKAPAQAGPAGGAPSGELSGRIAVMADKATNSLIVMASPEDYQTLSQVIKKLDRRPKQVFVEAMITEVSIGKSLELGTKFRTTAFDGDEPIAIGGFGTVDSTSVQDILSGMAGLTIGGLANFFTVPVTQSDGTVTELTVPGFAALFSLSEFKDAINVLSTPHILTSDNKEAEIIVGENVPFLSKLETPTATDTTLLQSIERKDVGITLRIKPQISEGDYIKLDIYQEISAISTSTASATAADLITTKRSAKTSVVVKDKQTVVIGGLIQDKESQNNTKVPLLGDIPVIGWLFKSDSSAREKTNLLVYLTPTIIKDFENLDAVRQKKEGEYKSDGAPGETRPAQETPLNKNEKAP